MNFSEKDIILALGEPHDGWTAGEIGYTYNHLEGVLSMSRADISGLMHKLRNEGYVKLESICDADTGMLAGSGWCLTLKGVTEYNKLHAELANGTP